MGNAGQVRNDGEVERLRAALDAETQRCLALQRQLDGTGADFEQFVSLAAHDLRESLRYVASFSQLMAETHAGRLDSDGSLFLSRIQEEAAKAQSLLAGVVDYWAALTGQRECSRTEMGAVVRQALLATAKLISEQSAIVTYDPMPAVTGDFELLSKVVSHLIRNAIEYRGTDSPTVNISSRRVDDDWEFSVKDNGAGIDPAFQGRVFGVFVRLHGREHSGNGLGLAFCKKAIEWHGGRIWMQSAPGSGSTFYFTLPAAD